MLILSHPTGNPNVRHALAALDAAGLLQSFYTTLAWPRWLGNLFGTLPARRSYPISYSKICPHPLGELMRLLLPGKVGPSIDEVYRRLDAALARDLPSLARDGKLKGVYCYEDGASQTFLAAKKLSLQTFYELPIGHHKAAQQLFRDEALLNPAWAPTLTGLRDSEKKLVRKDVELAMADRIFVPSSFTAHTLAGLISPKQTLSVIPYGAPPPGPLERRHTSGKLKVLYVGALTQRKGLSYLFDAVVSLHNHLTLTVIGRPPVSHCGALEKAIAAHTHKASLPHSEILEQMRRHDVLIFPSLFEGFGLVLTEALSCGLPVITTANTAAPDFITDGHEGFIVPIRSSVAITEKLTWMIKNRTALAAMQEAAYQRAQQLSWQVYEQTLIKELTRHGN